MNRYIQLGGLALVVCFLSAVLAACLSGQREQTGTAAGASTASTQFCTYEDGVWTCGDDGGGGGGGGGGGNPTEQCPGGRVPVCVACSTGGACVASCVGDFTCLIGGSPPCQIFQTCRS